MGSNRRAVHTRAAALLCLAIMAAVANAQEHAYTQGDIEEGARQFRGNCIGCHGPEGNQVGGIDLGRGKFRHVSTDEEIVGVVLSGVPGTGMPAFPMTPPRVYTIVAYLRNMNATAHAKSIAAASGDVTRGKALFESKGGCVSCHRVFGQGSRSGPDLSETGLSLRAIEIETSILDPDADYSLTTRPYRVVSKDGSTTTGSLLNQDTSSVQLQDQEGNLRSLPKSGLAGFGFVKSPMPSYRGRFDAQDLADVISYVGSLKGVPAP